jgi:hypothetical protein
MEKAEPNANLLILQKESERVAKIGKPPRGLLSVVTVTRLEDFYSDKKPVEKKPS